jgi:hypothetical protein
MESLPLQFWTKQVKIPNDLGTHLWEAGGIVAVISVFLLRRLGRGNDWMKWGLIGVGVGLLLVLIGLAIRKGKRSRVEVLDTDIIVSSKEIRIGGRTFAIDRVEYLDFLVNSYKGMPSPWRRRRLSNGLDNKIYFTADGQKHAYGFYLEDGVAMQRLGMLFRELYQKQIRFRERNRGGRTFLFGQVMNREQFEAKKRIEGYL